MQNRAKPLVEIKQLNTHFVNSTGFFKGKTVLHAVKNMQFSINEGETFGLVGESGCGKSTLGRTLLRLYKPTSGQILFQGKDIAKLSEKELKPFRKEMQSIFQDPLSSLNPNMTVEQLVGESLQIHDMYQGINSKIERKEYIVSLLEKVGLQSMHLSRYPHEFSGGQRQRISIARALAVKPKFIVCDEPLSALDVSVQAQVVNLLQDLQKEFGITYLFIAHDLDMIRHISHHIGVMFLGALVETGTCEELYTSPLHPYTQMLLNSTPKVPNFNEDIKNPPVFEEGIKIAEPKALDISNNNQDAKTNVSKGCLFASRCPHATPKCLSVEPKQIQINSSHKVSCHLYS
ncbi:ABC transporter ATP-binding protein [Thorsellia kenyensis]|uniref:ABC transporter ATP-binding protein n=1 Tax=Thorsellia kenyensis TaxID=1549888 RepID=A0ABV6C8F5_9GAMM